jgi:hypothetical protein
LRTCFGIQPVDEVDVAARDQVHVLVSGDLDGTVPHLVAHGGQRCSRFDKQAAEGVSQVVKAEAAQAGVLKDR